MSVKITSFEAENVKRIKAVQFTPSEDGLTIIGGKNANGKTSVLDSIVYALGGEKNRPKNFFMAKARSLAIHVRRYSKMMSMFGRVATCQFTNMLTGSFRIAAEEFGEK